MAFVYADRVKETSTTTGTGTLDLAGAATGYRTFVAGIGDTNTCPYVIEDANGTAWEVGVGTVTDAAPDTLARTTLLSSSTGSAISLSAGTHTVFCDWPAARAKQATLEHVAGTDADTTMAVGQMYVVDMSAWATADRNYTLPAVAAVGDRIGVMVSAGDASHELILKANTGDTLNGVSAAEWSRLFITGEVVIMRCTVADTTWVVEIDRRIASKCSLALTTDATGETAATYTYPTSNSGVWTADHEIGFVGSVTLGKFIARRAGKYNLYGCARAVSTPADQKYFQMKFELDGSTSIFEPSTVSSAAGASATFVQGSLYGYTLAVDGYIRFMYRSEEGSKGCRGSVNLTQFAIQEVF